MTPATLKFSSLTALWSFIKDLNGHMPSVHIETLEVSGTFSFDEIAKAINDFNAVVINL